MNPSFRLVASGTAGGLNALALLAPAFFLRHGPFWDASLLAAVAGVSLAVTLETFCWLPVPISMPATSASDLDWLNWTQGLGLLAGFEACCVWHLYHPAGVLAWLAAGLLLVIVGSALRAAAILRLGAGFTNSAAPGRNALCTGGIYAWLRHPAEAGLFLIVAGFSVALQVWVIAAITLPVFAALSVLRVHLEERGLARAFPDAFQAYCRRVRL